MKTTRRSALTGLAGVWLATWPASALAYGQTESTEPVVQIETTFDLPDLPDDFTLVQHVDDFAPGAFTSPHTHGGPAFGTAVSGEITWRANGVDHHYLPGQNWLEPPNVVHQSGNATSAPARMLVVFLLPPNAPLTTVSPGPAWTTPGPRVTFEARFPVRRPALPVRLIQQVAELPPAPDSFEFTAAAWSFHTLIDGVLTVTSISGDQTLKPGDTWSLTPGRGYRYRAINGPATFVSAIFQPIE